MRLLRLAAACALASLISGCVYSVHPVLRESDLTKDLDLSGTWKSQGVQVPEINDVKLLTGYTFTAEGFTEGAASEYDVSWAGKDFVAQVGRIGDDYYMQIQKAELTPEAPPLLTALPVYAIAKVTVIGDKLEVFKIDESHAVPCMKKNKVPPRQYEPADMVELFVFTGTTESVQELVRQSAGDLFSKTPMTFVRVPKNRRTIRFTGAAKWCGSKIGSLLSPPRDRESSGRGKRSTAMSMIYILRQASQSTLDRLHSEPSLVMQFFACQPQRAPARKGLLSRIFARRASGPADDSQFPSDVEECSLEKSWHGLHFLLSGSAWEGEPPAGFLLNWGREIGDADLGYGPAFSFTPDQTAQISEALARINCDSLRKRFDPDRMTELEIYPNIWQHRDADEGLADLLAAYDNLRQFVTMTYRQGLGMVGYIG